jgi:hypothetical protein
MLIVLRSLGLKLLRSLAGVSAHAAAARAGAR